MVHLDVLEDGAQLLQVLLVDLQLEVELRKVSPERRLAPAELGERLLALLVRLRLCLLVPGLRGARLGLLRRVDQLWKGPEVRVAALDLLVDDDPVESLLAV